MILYIYIYIFFEFIVTWCLTFFPHMSVDHFIFSACDLEKRIWGMFDFKVILVIYTTQCLHLDGLISKLM